MINILFFLNRTKPKLWNDSVYLQLSKYLQLTFFKNIYVHVYPKHVCICVCVCLCVCSQKNRLKVIG